MTTTETLTIRRRFAPLVVLLGVALALIAAGPAAADWSQQTTQSPAGTTELDAVSCSSPAACTAVGPGQAERWNGTSWQLQGTVPGIALAAVACAGPSACTAVGSSGSAAAAETWNGATWMNVTVPVPPGSASSLLSGVACTSQTACTAVGSSTDGSGTTRQLAERWNGSVWTIQSTVAPPGSTASSFHSVSCPSATACTAVGDSTSASGQATLVEVWNGSVWSIQASPNPPGSTHSSLAGVACPSVKACMAVSDGFSERWNGTAWTVVKVRKAGLSTSGAATLTSVSCGSPTMCMATGYYYRDAVQTIVGEAWNGSVWQLQDITITSSNDLSSFGGVSCPAATACTAVGTYSDSGFGSRTLAEGFAAAWSLQALPSTTAPQSELDGVSCRWQPAACVAVGSFRDSAGNFETLAESEDNGGWSLSSTPLPAGTTWSALAATSCWTTNGCAAVGFYHAIGNERPLAELWNGASWTLQTVPVPAGSPAAHLQGVSCPATNRCIAVGAFMDGSGAFSETWTGSTWTFASVPPPAGGRDASLTAVSCHSSSLCIGVGFYYTGTSWATFAARWNGTAWTPLTPPTPSGAFTVHLVGVSCPTATQCVAVGSYDVEFTGTFTLADVWNGKTWTLSSTPNPGSSLSALSGVSCTALNACTAVGTDDIGPTIESGSSLAEVWNGTSWTVQTLPTTSGVGNGQGADQMNAVSCSAAIACTAVGNFATAPDLGDGTFPIAEAFS